jgi:hypothetical protein
LLGISSGLVALIETGKRKLPENARQIVLNLSQLISITPPSEPNSKYELDAAEQKMLEKQLRVKTRQLNKSRMLLETNLDKLERLKRIATLGAQPEIESIWPQDSIEKYHWNLLLRKNSKKISKMISSIILLKINISGLEAEIETAQEEKNI